MQTKSARNIAVTPALPKKARVVNPEINQPISNIRPVVIRDNENSYLDANQLAEIQARRHQLEKEQQRYRQERIGHDVRLNASKLMSEHSQRMNDSRKIKQEVIIKQNQLRDKYTIVKQQKPKRITQKATTTQSSSNLPKVEWKSALSPDTTLQGPPPPVPKPQPKKEERRTSKSPSTIAHPKYVEEEGSESEASEIDSDVEEREQSMTEVLSKFEKIRTILRAKKR